jgi:hypothetical protein
MHFRTIKIGGPCLAFLFTLSCTSTPAEQPRTTARTRAATTARPAAPAIPTDLAATDFDLHVTQIKKRLPSNDFTVLVQPPFVVIGDGPAAEVQRRADDTVKWTVDKLKQDYFTKDPKEIIDIWLFKDAQSYEKNTQLLFNEKPTTPYGYYSPDRRALIMNIGTGGGTLVHEIVHPYMEANFPACPPWFNEGMGSLYERVGEEDGHIYGYVNWRLPRLQKEIKEGHVPAFETLMAMDANTFYADSTGVHYAQSRYLCYYLQEKKLLVKFYKQFYANQKTDPSGFNTLKTVLNESNMVQFQKRWEKFVLGLSY